MEAPLKTGGNGARWFGASPVRVFRYLPSPVWGLLARQAGGARVDIPVRSNGPQRIAFDAEGDFLKTVRARVHEALQGCAPRGNPRQLRKAAFIAVWFLASFALMLAAGPIPARCCRVRAAIW